MPAQRGRDLLVKVLTTNGYVTVAGIRSSRLSFNAETVDVTDRDSAGRWRELLAQAGSRRAGLSGSGIFRDQESDALIRSAFFSGDPIEAEIVIPDFGTVSAAFQITALDYSASHAGEVGFEIALESAGPVSFAVLP